jgi:glycerol kinase
VVGARPPHDWFCQFLADVLDAPVAKPAQLETTALGAAYLAGLATGVWVDLKAVAASCAAGTTFAPNMAPTSRAELVAGWKTALRRTLTI